MTKVRLQVLLGVLTALMLVAAFALFSVDAHASVGDSFDLNCDYSHSGSYDPIVYPRQLGVSHRHDFMGAESTNQNSTAQSLANGPTTCQNTHDHAAYWAPAAYVNGTRIFPDNIKAYYIHQVNGAIEPWPFGLKMLAGSGSATTAQPTSVIYYGCGSGSGISKVNYAPNCSTVGGELAIHVIFPDCGDGRLDSADHRSHTAYSSNHACPSGFSRHFPQLQMRLNYNVADARTLQFSCKAAQPSCNTTTMRAPFYTVHGDFFNAWEPAELARLVGTI